MLVSPILHPGRLAAALVLAASGFALALPGTAMAAPVTTDPAEAAAGWLTTQLVDGDHIEITIDLNGDGVITDDERFPDYGLTADTIIALAAAGVGADSAAAATDYLEANVELYVGDADVDDDGVDDPDGEYYAGALGKTALVAAVTGRDATDFGGVDLVARLLATETPTGRFSDISAFGDFSNNVGQSLALLALARNAPALLSPAALGFLPSQQCRDGGPLDGNVPLIIDADACVASSASIDTTSFAVQAMLAADAADAADAALEFLVRQQDDSGGFSDMGVANSNSTGLAAQALRVGGRDEAADDAARWLTAYQIGCAAAAEQQGAIAFTTEPDGAPLYDDRATRSTAQATPGLAGVGLLDVTTEGSRPQAPRLDCGTPTPTPTATQTPTPTPTVTATPTGSPTATPTDTHPPTQTGSPTSGPGLPNTGADIGPMLGFAGASLLLGGGLLITGRRRVGAHR